MEVEDEWMINRPTEYFAERMIEVDRKALWRVIRYGRVCLTHREFRILTMAQRYLERSGTASGLQSSIAATIGCSQVNVSRTLVSAEAILALMELRGIEWYWEQGADASWYLHAPVGRARHGSPPSDSRHKVHML